VNYSKFISEKSELVVGLRSDGSEDSDDDGEGDSDQGDPLQLSPDEPEVAPAPRVSNNELPHRQERNQSKCELALKLR
jgi:hypothetical protein